MLKLADINRDADMRGIKPAEVMRVPAGDNELISPRHAIVSASGKQMVPQNNLILITKGPVKCVSNP